MMSVYVFGTLSDAYWKISAAYDDLREQQQDYSDYVPFKLFLNNMLVLQFCSIC